MALARPGSFIGIQVPSPGDETPSNGGANTGGGNVAAEGKGHPVAEANAPLGGAQAVLIDEARGTLAAGSDPRKDGMALCY